MLKFLNRFRESPTDRLEEQLFEAERMQIEHQSSAEHHQALANMYAGRISRVRGILQASAMRQKVVNELHHGGQVVARKAVSE